MEKFNRTRRGYDPDEVNAFLDKVIKQVEEMVAQIHEKDKKISELESKLTENGATKEKLDQYVRMEDTLNRAILMAQKTSDQIKVTASRESELLLDNAKKNASRIVNDALLRAEKIEDEAQQLKRNVNIFKRRLREIIENQLAMVDDIEKIDL